MSKTLKWAGSLHRLKQAVTFAGRVGAWSENDHEARFRGDQGEVLTFWPKTGTISVQGVAADAFLGELVAELGLRRNTLDFG